MKIAIACNGEHVSEHFGHCERFTIFHAEGLNVISEENVANPGHRPGFLPVFLNELGIDVIISGGMGGGAVSLFNENGIEVIVGASGTTKTVAEQYLQGALKSTGSVCHDHMHHDSCGS